MIRRYAAHFSPNPVQTMPRQPRYTLLRKEKRNLETGDVIVQYDRLTPKQPKDQDDMREEYDRSAVSNGRLNPYIDRLK